MWENLDESPALGQLSDSQVVRIAADGDVLAAVRQSCNDRLSLSVDAGPDLCSELTEQTNRRLLHMVNYQSDPEKNLGVTLRLPQGYQAEAVTLVSPERQQDISLAFEVHDGCVKFNVPEVDVYEIAVVDMK